MYCWVRTRRVAVDSTGESVRLTAVLSSHTCPHIFGRLWSSSPCTAASRPVPYLPPVPSRTERTPRRPAAPTNHCATRDSLVSPTRPGPCLQPERWPRCGTTYWPAQQRGRTPPECAHTAVAHVCRCPVSTPVPPGLPE